MRLGAPPKPQWQNRKPGRKCIVLPITLVTRRCNTCIPPPSLRQTRFVNAVQLQQFPRRLGEALLPSTKCMAVTTTCHTPHWKPEFGTQFGEIKHGASPMATAPTLGVANWNSVWRNKEMSCPKEWYANIGNCYLKFILAK